MATALALAVLPAGAAKQAAPPGGPELYNRLAHAPTVVLGRVGVVGRRAEIRVEESLRGELPAPVIEVAFRSGNFLRNPETPPATFKEGEQALLLLVQETDKKKRPIEGRYELLDGPAGKIPLPLEGREAFFLVVRRFLAIQGLDNQLERWEEIRALLKERDLRLLQVGLQKIVAFRLVDDDLLPELEGFLQHPSPEIRFEAIGALEQAIVPVGRRSPTEQATRVVSRLTGVARADQHAEVRAAAIRALGRLRSSTLEDLFREAALEDPSQVVRYEASVALSDLGGALPPP